jgi:hypothetical protein
MRPEIQQILRTAGLVKESESKPNQSLSDRLNAAGLSLDELLEELSLVAKTSGNDGLKLRALETALKAHGALKENSPQVPSFTIIIQDGNSPQSNIPQGVNPILLPRQLLKKLNPSQLELVPSIEVTN